MSEEVKRLPVPVRLEPKNAERSLFQSVKGYFYALYNSDDDAFRQLLASVGNNDAITGRRDFDRYEAVAMIKLAAKEARDTATAQAKPGTIYKHLTRILNNHPEMKIKHRRIEFQQRGEYQQAAE